MIIKIIIILLACTVLSLGFGIVHVLSYNWGLAGFSFLLAILCAGIAYVLYQVKEEE